MPTPKEEVRRLGKRPRLSELGGSLPTGRPFVGIDEEEEAVRASVANRLGRGGEG